MMVFDLLREGFSSVWLPCSLLLLVPGAASVLAAEEDAIPSTVGFALAATVVAWLRFADRGADWPVAVAAVALVAAVVAYVGPVVVSERVLAVGGGVLVGGAAALLWAPCPGPQVDRLLTELPLRGAGGLVELAVLLIGVLAPVAGLVAVIRLTPLWIMETAQGALGLVGATILTLAAAAVAVGLHDEVVSHLHRWSL